MQDKEQHLVEHLGELRKRIIIVAASFILFFILGFVYVKDIYKWFVRDLDVKLTVLGPSDIIWVYMSLAGVIAVAATIPIFALQLWLFVRPALTVKERRVTLNYIPALFILFILGLSFGYFIIFPIVFKFLLELSGDMVVTIFTASNYFTFILHMTIPFGILFELPVVVMFLTSLGIINPFVLSKIRKYAYFVLIIVAITITPPEVTSDILVSIPLLLLYELSISLSKIVYKRRLKKQAENEVLSADEGPIL
ncbi:twin-arginine translocase subunit TatC [Peribacillus deserti]|uniref:Sec-independent protein translocase protein TatC n=1 Tax=Peribacillus deserti TaxID=673318 RepID=A0A2N5M2Y5_9BACI|nr:twin-arginine translocase subunit TatC [Peribacillus deserti]PLT28734.1 twin-arginine translocase subunit TatC [Peribacillus deserti]